jgi:hypothetical protein
MMGRGGAEAMISQILSGSGGGLHFGDPSGLGPISGESGGRGAPPVSEASEARGVGVPAVVQAAPGAAAGPSSGGGFSRTVDVSAMDIAFSGPANLAAGGVGRGREGAFVGIVTNDDTERLAALGVERDSGGGAGGRGRARGHRSDDALARAGGAGGVGANMRLPGDNSLFPNGVAFGAHAISAFTPHTLVQGVGLPSVGVGGHQYLPSGLRENDGRSSEETGGAAGGGDVGPAAGRGGGGGPLLRLVTGPDGIP